MTVDLAQTRRPDPREIAPDSSPEYWIATMWSWRAPRDPVNGSVRPRIGKASSTKSKVSKHLARQNVQAMRSGWATAVQASGWGRLGRRSRCRYPESTLHRALWRLSALGATLHRPRLGFTYVRRAAWPGSSPGHWPTQAAARPWRRCDAVNIPVRELDGRRHELVAPESPQGFGTATSANRNQESEQRFPKTPGSRRH